MAHLLPGVYTFDSLMWLLFVNDIRDFAGG